jgi:hypothetical protein
VPQAAVAIDDLRLDLHVPMRADATGAHESDNRNDNENARPESSEDGESDRRLRLKIVVLRGPLLLLLSRKSQPKSFALGSQRHGV